MNSIRRIYDVLGAVVKWIEGWETEDNLSSGTKASSISAASAADKPGAPAGLPKKPTCFSIVRVPPQISMHGARRDCQDALPRI